MEDSAALVVIGVVAYLLPSLIAAGRKVPNLGSVLVINIFLGWTFVGWIVALAMAARSVPRVQPLPPTRWSPPPGN